MAQESQAQHTTPPGTMAPKGQAALAERMARAEAIAEKTLALEAAALKKAAAEPVLQKKLEKMGSSWAARQENDTAGEDGKQRSPEQQSQETQAQEACHPLSPPHHTNLQI